VLTLITSIAIAQKYISQETYDYDSIIKLLPERHNEEKINELNKIIVSLSLEDFDSSMYYADLALNLAEEIDDTQILASLNRNIGLAHHYQANYPAALNYFFEALQMFELLDDKNMIARLYYDIATVHYYAGSLKKSLEYCLISLEKYRERKADGSSVGNIRDTITALAGLALVYHQMGEFEKQVMISKKIVDVGSKNNFCETEMMLHTMLLGIRFYQIGETDSAMKYYRKALAYPDVNLDIVSLKNRVLRRIGDFYFASGNIDSAMIYLHKALTFYTEKGFLLWMLYVSNDIGQSYATMGDLTIAEKYYKLSEEVFKEMVAKNSWFRHDSSKHVVTYGMKLYVPLSPRFQKEMMWSFGQRTYYGLYQVYTSKANAVEALKYHILYANARDTLSNIQRIKDAMEVTTKYETTRKEEEIALLSQMTEIQKFRLRQSSYLMFGFAGLIILVIILAMLLIRQNKLREERKTLLLQQRLFRSQMNPHFLFNSLGSIHNFILSENAAKAAIYLNRFSKLVRSILNSSVNDFFSLEEEIGMIENYLELQKVRFPGKFDFTIKVDDVIDTEEVHIPSMLTQPFIENAIHHGIKMKPVVGNIWIRFKRQDSVIIFEVEDDGVGRKKASELQVKQKSKHKPLSTSITAERIRVLNKTLEKKIKLEIRDLTDARHEPLGTLVRIELPDN
jgi:tetratricopeptide (TPR) repeat protein